ncbi:RNA-binding S4 domain-containing protein [Pseudomonadota bacterium AL_CKDN230030165-1A_HGKHYDSX7]
MDKIRLDKWLWAARFYKTRSLASTEIGKGRVQVNGQPAKPAREVAPDDLITIRKDDPAIEVRVVALSAVRGPAPAARLLYEETEASRTARERAAEMRRLAPEPALGIAAGRPTKRDRRLIDQVRGK